MKAADFLRAFRAQLDREERNIYAAFGVDFAGDDDYTATVTYIDDDPDIDDAPTNDPTRRIGHAWTDAAFAARQTHGGMYGPPS